MSQLGSASSITVALFIAPHRCFSFKCFKVMLLGTECVFRVFTLSRALECVSLVAQLVKKKKSACNAGDPGSVSGLGRSPGEENGNPLQYSCWENPMDRGAWRAAELDMTTPPPPSTQMLWSLRGPWWKVGLCCRAVPPSLGLTLWSGGAHRRLELWHHHNGNWLGLGPCPGYTTYNL